MSVREFKIFNESERAFIAEQVTSVVRNWSEKWFNDQNLAEVEIFKPDELNDLMKLQHVNSYLGEYDNNVFALYCSNEFMDSLCASIIANAEPEDIGLSINTYIARKLVNINISSLIDDICKSFYSQKNTIRNSHMNQEEFLQQANRYGSGYIFIKLSLKNNQFMLIAIELSSVQKSGTSSNKKTLDRELSPAINAFGNHTVKLDVIVGTSVIDIRSLTNMAVGDVLTIDSGDNTDIDLHIDNKKVCTGKIGRVGNNFAVKINSI